MITKNNKQKVEPRKKFLQPPFPKPKKSKPSYFSKRNASPYYGEQSYVGSGKLKGKKVVITGGDFGIGRAIAIAYAREGADILISYLHEDEDALDTSSYVEKEGKKAILVKGDVRKKAHCEKIMATAISSFGTIDVLINNAAFQQPHTSLLDIKNKEWKRTFEANIHAMFYLYKAAELHMKLGSCIINTTSATTFAALPSSLAYTTSKGAIENLTSNLAQLLAEKGIRVNCVASESIWTPLTPAVVDVNTPSDRTSMPAEVTPAYVLLASEEASYITGATIPVTRGMSRR